MTAVQTNERITNIIQSIATLTGIDEVICRAATQEVLAFYASSAQYAEELTEKLYLWLADGQETRAVVHQFREQVSRLTVAWKEFLAVPSYVEQQAAMFAAEPTPALAKRRKLGTAFFYYHEDCGEWRDDTEYEAVLVADCHAETVCCGCWGLLHAPRVE